MLNSLGKMCFAKYAKEMDIGPWFQELNSLFRSVKCDGGCFDTYCTQNLFIGSIVLCFILYNKTDFSVFSCCHLSKEERENCATCQAFVLIFSPFIETEWASIETRIQYFIIGCKCVCWFERVQGSGPITYNPFRRSIFTRISQKPPSVRNCLSYICNAYTPFPDNQATALNDFIQSK